MKKPTRSKLPVPYRIDDRFRCTRCRGDASFGYTSVQNKRIKEGVRLCIECYQKGPGKQK